MLICNRFSKLNNSDEVNYMVEEKYTGFEKEIKDTLVAARGVPPKGANTVRTGNTRKDKILSLEQRLETEKLTNEQIADIRKQLKALK
jgi:hypothetical protein